MHLVQLNPPLLPTTTMSLAVPAQPTVLTENALCDRLAEAQAGDVITYHVGMLARDRAPQTQVLSPDRCRDLGAVADRALKLAEAGWVHLVQRRMGEERFTYLAIVRPRPRARRGVAMPLPVAAQRAEAA
jgi:hypothetical protein